MGKSEEMKRFAGRRAGSCEALVAAQIYVNEGGGGGETRAQLVWRRTPEFWSGVCRIILIKEGNWEGPESSELSLGGNKRASPQCVYLRLNLYS